MANEAARARQKLQRSQKMLTDLEQATTTFAQLTHDVASLDRAILEGDDMRAVAIRLTACFLTASVMLEHLSTLMVDVWNEL